jgi:putative transposase
MKTNKAFKYELDPNRGQLLLLARHAGTARFAYNWGLARKKDALERKEKVPTAIDLHRELNLLKKTDFPWMYEVSKCAPQEALRNLDVAFRNFWNGRRKGRKTGFPKFKKKGVHDSFRFSTGAIHAFERHVQLPKLGRIRVKEPICASLRDIAGGAGKVLSATVSRVADRWYASFTVEHETSDPVPVQGPVVGVDLGVNCFAVLSDGTEVYAPKPLQKMLVKLQCLSRQLSRKKKGSANRKKAAMRVARLHRRITNIRNDFLHKLSTDLAKTKSVIVLEDLNVKGMVRNVHLARHIADAGWGRFREMVKYKASWYGSTLVTAPAFFPSTKTCSVCGNIQDMPLKERTFECANCGAIMSRDLNAALNLEKLYTGSSPGINACGEEGSGNRKRYVVKPFSVKQEVTTVDICP